MDDKVKPKRGNAMPETAMVMGLLFLLLFGALNMAMLSYNQMMADGATFVAARAAAANPTNAPSAAASTVAGIFPKINTSNLSIYQSGTTVQASYTSTSPGLMLLQEHSTGAFNIFSREVEVALNSSNYSLLGTSTGAVFPFSVGGSAGASGTVPLNNYPGSTYNMWLAQRIVIMSGSGGGNNQCQGGHAGGGNSKGPCYDASEYAEHCEALATVGKGFTQPDNNIPTTPSANNAREKEISQDRKNWDPNTASSNNSVVYGWDASPHTYASPKYNGQQVKNPPGNNGGQGQC